MKKNTVLLFVLVVLVGAAAAIAIASPPETAPARGKVGRFRLFAANYQGIGSRSMLDVKGVFKLDTETGRVWILSVNAQPYSADWLEMGEVSKEK